ncbi:MAG: serine/threonine protein kinase [Nannocystaceae bacterium]|nr:serine/threonine protein kinase [Nannocystaceae bacterium]
MDESDDEWTTPGQPGPHADRETQAARPLPFSREPISSRPRLPLIRLAGLDTDSESPDFRIVREIGKGGTATVYEATETSVGRRVAVKVPRHDVDAAWVNERILRDAKVARIAEHPNVVPVYRVGRDQKGRVILVMKLVEGEPWSTALARPQQRPIDGKIRTLLAVCRALEFAHSRGLLHLDINPSNILLGSFGEVYVSDWGIARAIVDLPGIPPANPNSDIEGTPAYMPPEMAVPGQHSLSKQTDVYLLGVTLFEVLAGKRPRSPRTVDELRLHALDTEPLRLAESIPEELQNLVRESTDVVPSARPKSVTEFRHRLEDFLRNSASRAILVGASDRLAQLKIRISSGALTTCPELAREVQLGAQLALQKWPENRSAKRVAAELGQVMLEFELSRGSIVDIKPRRPTRTRACTLQRRQSAMVRHEHLALRVSRVHVCDLLVCEH